MVFQMRQCKASVGEVVYREKGSKTAKFARLRSEIDEFNVKI